MLARPGRYHEIRCNLQVKEVVIDDGAARDLFVICHNPEKAERDELIRTQLVDRLQEAPNDERTKLATGLPARSAATSAPPKPACCVSTRQPAATKPSSTGNIC